MSYDKVESVEIFSCIKKFIKILPLCDVRIYIYIYIYIYIRLFC